MIISNIKLHFSLLTVISPLILLASGCSSCSNRAEEDSGPQYVNNIWGFVADTLRREEGEIQPGESFFVLMDKLGCCCPQSDIKAASDGIFNPAKIIAGKKYEVWYSPTSDTLRFFVYHNERLSSLVFSFADSCSVKRVERETVREVKYSDVIIESSLWNDISTSGASQLLAIEMDNIFQWTVDFFGLAKGDRFRMLYSQTSCEGEVISIDTVFIAIATHHGAEIPAYFFPVEGSSNKYWGDKGESLRKQFLKAPLRFTRISSGFSYARRNPVTHKVQPHLAVDYAAPSGTAVMSVGDGTVISAGRSGAAGNMIKIKHPGKYESAYLHLRAFAKGIKAGVHVRQGQLIGYVGSTGRSTGPHLDFRIKKNGKAVNPLKIVSPPAEPLKGAQLEEFQKVKALRTAELQQYCQSPSPAADSLSSAPTADDR